jgi:hypothetical protein
MKGLFLLLFFFSLAPAFYNGRNMPGAGFMCFETPHFQFIYQKGLDSLAQHAARVGEVAFPTLCQDLWVRDKNLPRIDIILTDMDDESNGFSYVLGRKIELFAYPMLSLTTGDLGWIDRVVVHELAHQITYFALERMFGVYSQGYYLLFLPVWFVEGIAQFEAETWDKNREFLLRSAYNKLLLLDRERLYGYMGSNFVESRLLYEEGHSLYRFLVQNHGRDIGGRLLKGLNLFHPTLNSSLKRTIGVDERTLLFNWRLMLERDYPLSGAGGRPGTYAQEVSARLGSRFAQVYSLKRIREGFVFVGIERTEVFQKNLYSWFPDQGLKRLDGPEVGTFFTLMDEGRKICYSKTERDRSSGAILNALYISDLKGRKRPLAGLKGEEPCALQDGRLLFLRRRAGLTRIFTCGIEGEEVRSVQLPPPVAQIYRPLYANGRVYFSAIDFQGERTAASMAPDGSDFRIEAEKQGVDIRFPTVSARGALAYVSNEKGPFNVYLKDSSGAVTQVTADPYGVFAPDFDGSEDSLLITALRDDKENFDLSVFSVSASDERQGEDWNMEPAWKKVIGFDRSQAAQEEEGPGGARRSYVGLLQLRPLIVYPALVEGAPAVRAEFSDPLDKHGVTLGVLFQNPPAGLGYEAYYQNHLFYPDLGVSFQRYSRFYQETYENGWGLFKENRRQVARFSLSYPLNFPGAYTADQRIRFGLTHVQNDYRDSLYNGSYHRIYEYPGEREIPLSLGWSLGSVTPFAGSSIHPLDAFFLSITFSVADSLWKSESFYRILEVDYQQSIEVMKSYQTLFYRIGAGTFLSSSGYKFTSTPGLAPRGKDYSIMEDMERYLSGTLEYRIPLARDLGFSIFGFYFEMFTFAPFFDGLAYNLPEVRYRDAIRSAQTSWTVGLVGRQRLFFMGKGEYGLNLVFYYDKEALDPYGFRFNLSGGLGF